MPHDVIMPALGMAQDTGLLVAWHKNPGDAVKTGDILFEVETDKSTMEVEAQADGYLSHVKHAAGDDVPVGHVIAQITATAESSDTSAPTPAAAQTDGIPTGQSVIMPALGMAQDTGLIVAWHKTPGDAVASGDLLFEVETDKSTMEVEAGHDGYLAAVFYPAGAEAPVGIDIAIISTEKPAKPVALDRSRDAAPAPAEPVIIAAPQETHPPAPTTPAPVETSGKILASPKARRLALERGLDLADLVKIGHPQPYHVADLEVLANVKPAHAPATALVGAQTHRLVAKIKTKKLADFLAWNDGGNEDAILADFALNAAPPSMGTVALRNLVHAQVFDRSANILPESDPNTADLGVLDLRSAPLTHIAVGATHHPVLAIIAPKPNKAEIVLDYTDAQLDTMQALNLITQFAKTLEQPLRRLL